MTVAAMVVVTQPVFEGIFFSQRHFLDAVAVCIITIIVSFLSFIKAGTFKYVCLMLELALHCSLFVIDSRTKEKKYLA